jgi:hypothetical protein
MLKLTKFLAATLVWLPIIFAAPGSSQTPPPSTPEKIIIDTDIGDDVDDAFAVALALKSPEVEILGITTTFGDTEARAKLVDRMLGEAGRTDIPVAVGICGRRALFAGFASGCGEFYSGADSEKPWGDYPSGDWAAGECGSAHRQGCGDVSQAEAGGDHGRVG